MRGELIGVWSEMWRNVWRPLSRHRDAPDDLFCELFRDLNAARASPLDAATDLAAIVDDPGHARVAFRKTRAHELKGELAVVRFLEAAHQSVEDFGSITLTDRYFSLIDRFLEKFSLRYDLRRPFSLHATLQGVFARLMRDLRQVSRSDGALDDLMRAFDDSVRDLKTDQSPRRIKACIQAQMILLEAMAQRCPGVQSPTLGQMCKEIDTWPHKTVQTALSSMYGFTSDYPGIRHAGNPQGMKREVDMRDMVAVSVVLAGFTPYLSALLDADAIYSG